MSVVMLQWVYYIKIFRLSCGEGHLNGELCIVLLFFPHFICFTLVLFTAICSIFSPFFSFQNVSRNCPIHANFPKVFGCFIFFLILAGAIQMLATFTSSISRRLCFVFATRKLLIIRLLSDDNSFVFFLSVDLWPVTLIFIVNYIDICNC